LILVVFYVSILVLPRDGDKKFGAEGEYVGFREEWGETPCGELSRGKHIQGRNTQHLKPESR